MTPERKEVIKGIIEDFGKVGGEIGVELLATLEETEQRASKWEKAFDNADKQYLKQEKLAADLRRELAEAQQTIARQRKKLLATGLPEWAVDAIGGGAKEEDKPEPDEGVPATEEEAYYTNEGEQP